MKNKNLKLNYKYKDRELLINDILICFSYNIKYVKRFKNIVLVLLGMPYTNKDQPYNVNYLDQLINLNEIDNLYAIDYQGKIIWRSESREKLCINPEPYVDINIKDNKILACEFSGRCYFINSSNGKILKVEGYRF